MTDFLIAPKLNGEIVSSIEDSDPLNLEGRRTEKNTRFSNYNCGGYAFETYNWFLPNITDQLMQEIAWNQWNDKEAFDEEDFVQDRIDNYSQFEEEIIDKGYDELINDIILNSNFKEELAHQIFYCHDRSSSAIEYTIKSILAAFPDVRKIDNLRELKDNEYGIIYAVGEDDFHFVKYDQKINKYSHKMGWYAVEKVKNCDEAFGHRYDSKRIYFAKRRRDNGG